MPTLYDNFSQVKQYIDQNQVDLSSYVSKSELSNILEGYVSGANFSYNGQLKLVSSGLGVINTTGNIVPTNISYTNAVNTSQYAFVGMGTLKNYVDGRIAEIESSYATQTYVADYVTTYGGGSTVIDENIIPKETGTYTLGDESHLYSATYSSRLKVGNNSQIYNDGGGITLSVNSNAGIRMGSTNFYPKNNNGMNLGQSSNAWNNTYTSNLYTYTAYLQDTSYSSNIVPKETDTYTLGSHTDSKYYQSAYVNRIYLGSKCRLMPESVNGANLSILLNGNPKFYFSTDRFAPNGSSNHNALDLGTATRAWKSTYTYGLYINGVDDINTVFPTYAAVNGMFSYDSTTGTLTITTL